jgi:transcription-repair coupling factor (superfamily II helicase)
MSALKSELIKQLSQAHLQQEQAILTGIPLDLLIGQLCQIKESKHVIFIPDSYMAQAAQLASQNNNIVFWHQEIDPYLSGISSYALFEGLYSILNTIYFNNSAELLLIPQRCLSLTWPEFSEFKNHSLEIKKGDLWEIDQLVAELIKCGYKPGLAGKLTPGQFAERGETLDIMTLTKDCYRIVFFDIEIEFIRLFDLDSFRTVPEKQLTSVIIFPLPLFFCQEANLHKVRDLIPQISVGQKSRLEFRQWFFNEINLQQLPGQLFYYFPYLFKTQMSLQENFKTFGFKTIFFAWHANQPFFQQFLNQQNDIYPEALNSSSSQLLLPPPEKFFLPTIKLDHALLVEEMKNSQLNLTIHWDIIPLEQYLKENNLYSTNNRTSKLENLSQWLKSNPSYLKNILIFYTTSDVKEKFGTVIDSKWQNLGFNYTWHAQGLKKSYINVYENCLYLAADEFIYSTQKIKPKRKNNDLFAEHLATLKEGDFVVHQDHGVGIYLGIQNLELTGSKATDYLVLKYQNDDKIYVPIYKLNLIQKFADSSSESKPSDLRNKKFEQERERARSSAKKLAFDLIKIEAERKLAKGYAFNPPDELFEEFEKSFPYTETPDQYQAIDDVIKDMCSTQPMDRLICGDVGFGKTEVAMRAAFKAILDKKQVALLVPTTILSLQHFNNFKRRFQPFSVEVRQLSRLCTPKEMKESIQLLKEGKVDIIVGTHKILSKDVSFSDLGLVIIDEEHRFGVSDKEKLKLLRSNTDFLTLSATPIPRTLQMSFLGIRSLSLIQSPPPERKSIQSAVILNDDILIKTAIENELKRKGQVFYIHNKVQDIELIYQHIHRLVPKARIVIAHGQMDEKQLEKHINDFYAQKYDILLATTIVESGIDIPNANTMIINHAHAFGLAQLHQLRGRIGRSDQIAYCYFVVPKEISISELSDRRLQVLQKYTDVGSGFAIANSDLEIRGAGELLGAEQSGHIGNIGLELYMELLQESMNEIKGEKSILGHKIEIVLNLPTFIPHHYMQDESIRLKYYKLLSNIRNDKDLSAIEEEIAEIYGPIPEPLVHLLLTIKIRNCIEKLGITHFICQKEMVHLKFNPQYMETNPIIAKQLISYFLSHPKKYKFNNPQSVSYKSNVNFTADLLLEFAQQLKLIIMDKG